MAGYSREMLIDAYLTRYISTGNMEKLRPLAEKHYDEVGKDAFRVSASLDAKAVREYKALKK